MECDRLEIEVTELLAVGKVNKVEQFAKAMQKMEVNYYLQSTIHEKLLNQNRADKEKVSLKVRNKTLTTAVEIFKVKKDLLAKKQTKSV